MAEGHRSPELLPRPPPSCVCGREEEATRCCAWARKAEAGGAAAAPPPSTRRAPPPAEARRPRAPSPPGAPEGVGAPQAARSVDARRPRRGSGAVPLRPRRRRHGLRLRQAPPERPAAGPQHRRSASLFSGRAVLTRPEELAQRGSTSTGARNPRQGRGAHLRARSDARPRASADRISLRVLARSPRRASRSAGGAGRESGPRDGGGTAARPKEPREASDVATRASPPGPGQAAAPSPFAPSPMRSMRQRALAHLPWLASLWKASSFRRRAERRSRSSDGAHRARQRELPEGALPRCGQEGAPRRRGGARHGPQGPRRSQTRGRRPRRRSGHGPRSGERSTDTTARPGALSCSAASPPRI